MLYGYRSFVAPEWRLGTVGIEIAKRVTDHLENEFVTGRATLPLWAVGGITVLDAAGARAARGAEADPLAFFLIRGYVPAMIQVVVDDPDDPVPYWLVSTRHPEELAAALSAARDTVR